MLNHKTTPTQTIETHNSVQAAATKAVAKALREQGITSKLAKQAVVETRELNKLDSTLGNFFVEFYLVGKKQVFVFGEVAGGDRFYSSLTVKEMSSLEAATQFAKLRLDAFEYQLELSSKAVQYA